MIIFFKSDINQFTGFGLYTETKNRLVPQAYQCSASIRLYTWHVTRDMCPCDTPTWTIDMRWVLRHSPKNICAMMSASFAFPVFWIRLLRSFQNGCDKARIKWTHHKRRRYCCKHFHDTIRPSDVNTDSDSKGDREVRIRLGGCWIVVDNDEFWQRHRGRQEIHLEDMRKTVATRFSSVDRASKITSTFNNLNYRWLTHRENSTLKLAALELPSVYRVIATTSSDRNKKNSMETQSLLQNHGWRRKCWTARVRIPQEAVSMILSSAKLLEKWRNPHKFMRFDVFFSSESNSRRKLSIRPANVK